jgi:hypothetical protein
MKMTSVCLCVGFLHARLTGFHLALSSKSQKKRRVIADSDEEMDGPSEIRSSAGRSSPEPAQSTSTGARLNDAIEQEQEGESELDEEEGELIAATASKAAQLAQESDRRLEKELKGIGWKDGDPSVLSASFS